MRMAVLADVHANAPAVRAVLAELDHDRVDAIVVAGDVVGTRRTTIWASAITDAVS